MDVPTLYDIKYGTIFGKKESSAKRIMNRYTYIYIYKHILPSPLDNALQALCQNELLLAR